MSQTDGHPTLLFNIQSLYQSDAVAESFAQLMNLSIKKIAVGQVSRDLST